jgi:hypothetical protein
LLKLWYRELTASLNQPNFWRRRVTMAFIYYIFRQVSKTTRLTAAGDSPGADFSRFFAEGG